MLTGCEIFTWELNTCQNLYTSTGDVDQLWLGEIQYVILQTQISALILWKTDDDDDVFTIMFKDAYCHIRWL